MSSRILAVVALTAPLLLGCTTARAGGGSSTAIASATLSASTPDTASTPGAIQCAACAEWNVPQRPLRLHGNTHFVGTHGLSAILLTSSEGHVLLDAGLPQSAPLIRANIEALGFRMGDVKLIVNSHAHYDHAGGIAELQRASGATVGASEPSAPVIATGRTGRDDPQFGVDFPYPGAARVKAFAFGDTLRVGPLAIASHATPGHTRGGTSWSWRSCADGRCLDFVYADSQTPVSSDSFLFTRNTTYPTVLADFERGFATLESMACDVLITPHPAASGLWQRVSPVDGTVSPTFVDPTGCKRYAATARQALARRVAREREPGAN
jgi:metallo-beta-lactamase class B